MNGHRTALAALLTAARDERSRASGPNGTYEERARLDDRIATLDAALTAGDEAEQDDDDEDDEGLTPAQVVESHLTLRALRRSLARALGRRMISHALLGSPTDLEPPTDDVMLSEVEDLRRGALARREVVESIRKALDLPRTTPDAEIAGRAEALLDRVTSAVDPAEHRRALDEMLAQSERYERLVSALCVLAGLPLDSDEPVAVATLLRQVAEGDCTDGVERALGVWTPADTETRQD